MGRQINFYLHPDDFIKLDEKLSSKDELLFLSGIQDQDSFVTINSLIFPESINDHQQLFVYICRKIDINKVYFRKRPYDDNHVVDINRSNAIEFHMPQIKGKILKRGRFYFTPGYWNENDAWIEKADDFKKWGDRMLRIARKFCPNKVIGGYATFRVIEWQKKTSGKLSQI